MTLSGDTTEYVDNRRSLTHLQPTRGVKVYWMIFSKSQPYLASSKCTPIPIARNTLSQGIDETIIFRIGWFSNDIDRSFENG